MAHGNIASRCWKQDSNIRLEKWTYLEYFSERRVMTVWVTRDGHNSLRKRKIRICYCIIEDSSVVKINSFIKKQYHHRKRKKMRSLSVKLSTPLKFLLLQKSPVTRHKCTLLSLLSTVNFISKISESMGTLTSGWFMRESQQLDGDYDRRSTKHNPCEVSGTKACAMCWTLKK